MNIQGAVKVEGLVKPDHIILILIVTLMGFIVYWFTGLEML